MNERSRTWSQWLGACLLLLVAGPRFSASPAQSRAPGEDDLTALQVAHREAVQVERERDLLEAWTAATADGRELLVRGMRKEGDPRRSSLRPLELRQISRALRELDHKGPDTERGAWYELLDSLDLRLRPGVFEARSEGRGEAITVSLEPVWSSAFEGDLTQTLTGSLIWISAQGEELVARREPVTARSLKSGFEMYIRPPLSSAQTWQLVFELQTPGGVVRGIPVVVECVPELSGMRERLGRPVAGQDGAVKSWNEPLRQRILTRHELLVRHGIRVAGGVPLAQWIASYDASGPQPSGPASVPDVLLKPIDGRELGVPGETFWEFPGVRASGRILLLLVDSRESPTDVLTGPQGAAWRELSRATGLRVVAGHLPLGPADMQPLEDLARTLQAAEWAAGLFVVARGDSGRILPRLLSRKAVPGLDGLILSDTLAAGAPLDAQLSVNALRVQFGVAPADLGVSESRRDSIRHTHVTLALRAPLAIPGAIDAIRVWVESL